MFLFVICAWITIQSISNYDNSIASFRNDFNNLVLSLFAKKQRINDRTAIISETKFIATNLYFRNWTPYEEFLDLYDKLNKNDPIYTEEEIKTQDIKTLTETEVHVKNTVFSECSAKAIYYENQNSNCQILIEFSTFFDCHSSNDGGAINAQSCDCILYCVCSNGCNSTTTNAYGQFIFTSLYNNDKLNYINSSSVCLTPESKGYNEPIGLQYGKQICTSVNISHNKVSYWSAIYFDRGSNTSYITFCSINSNYASGCGCIYLNNRGTEYEIDTCNIINNEQQKSASFGTISCWKNTTVRNCCILNNNALYLFYILQCTLTLIDCHCPSIKYTITNNGDLNTNDIKTFSFINYLKMTETGKVCLTGIDQFDDLTPIIPKTANGENIDINTIRKRITCQRTKHSIQNNLQFIFILNYPNFIS